MIDSSMTILQMKNYLYQCQSLIGINPNLYRFSYQGELLENEKLLKEYGIEANSLIQIDLLEHISPLSSSSAAPSTDTLPLYSLPPAPLSLASELNSSLFPGSSFTSSSVSSLSSITSLPLSPESKSKIHVKNTKNQKRKIQMSNKTNRQKARANKKLIKDFVSSSSKTSLGSKRGPLPESCTQA